MEEIGDKRRKDNEKEVANKISKEGRRGMRREKKDGGRRKRRRKKNKEEVKVQQKRKSI